MWLYASNYLPKYIGKLRFACQALVLLALHLLQVSLVYVNTLTIQQVLAEAESQASLSAVDLPALSPLR